MYRVDYYGKEKGEENILKRPSGQICGSEYSEYDCQPKKFRKLSDDEFCSTGGDSEEEKKCCNKFIPNLTEMLTCPQGHSFAYNKKKNKKVLCPVCEFQRREEDKEKLKKEETAHEREMEEKQQRLFNEAKQKMLAEQQGSNSSLPSDLQSKIISAYQHSIQRITALIEANLDNFRRKSNMSEYEYSCTKNVTQFIMIPESILKCY